MNFIWTPEEKARVADLLQRGKTAKQIGEVIGVTRNAIIGIVARDKMLSAIGFSRRGSGGVREKKLTHDERLIRRRQYDVAYRARIRGEVIAFPKPLRPRPTYHLAPTKSPALRVITNIPMLVEDWLKQNGGPRRFERTATSDTWVIRLYLEERGVKLNGQRGKWGISNWRGRPRLGTWADVMKVADEFRVAEGLQPFISKPKQQGAAG